MTQLKHTTDVTVKDAARGIVEATFCRLNVIDHDGDVILPGAIPSGANVVISAYGHKSWEGQMPVGTGTIREVGDEAIMSGQFLMDTTHGRDAFITVKELADRGLGEWSFSLQQVTAKRGTWQGRPANLISKIGKVTEVSPVLQGAGIGTRTLVAKAAGGPAEREAIAILERYGKQRQRENAEAEYEYLRFLSLEYLRLMEDIKQEVAGWHYYSECASPSAVSSRIAVEHASRCAAELGITRPEVRWMAPESDLERCYATRWSARDWPSIVTERDAAAASEPAKGRLWLRADALTDPDEIRALVAHEVRHVAGGDETEARAYENQWRTRLGIRRCAD